MTPQPKVLFLCTGNSCRSQMAEGLLRHYADDSMTAASAGTRPAGLNPLAIEAMHEVEVDISRQRSKHVDTLRDEPFDYVITVCDHARANCPLFPGSAVTLHWGLDDPAEAEGSGEEKMAVFRRVRDEIATLVREFVKSRPQGTGMSSPQTGAKR